MSLNQLNVSDGRITLQGDRVIKSQEGVEASFDAQGRMPDDFKGTKKGTVFLTTRMMILLPKSDRMKSFTVPFNNMKNVEVKQPVFGANQLAGSILAAPNGGWEGKVNFRWSFTKGGAIEMSQALMRAVKAARNVPAPAPGPVPSAPYPGGYPQPMPPFGPGPYQNGGAYNPNQGQYAYPPPGTVYPPGQPEQPPPPYYAAPVGTAPPQPQQAYWDPNNQNVYIPQAQPSAPPPPYTEKSKTD